MSEVNHAPLTPEQYATLCQVMPEVIRLDEEFALAISNKQTDWMDDLIIYWNTKNYRRFSQNAIDFLSTIASGFYTVTGDF